MNLQGNESNCYQYKFVSSVLCGEIQADGRGASDRQPACGEGLPSERQGDCKTRLASLITQTRICTENVPTAMKPHSFSNKFMPCSRHLSVLIELRNANQKNSKHNIVYNNIHV